MSDIAKTAIISANTIIGKNVKIHDYVVIYDNVEISDGVEIFEFTVVGKKPSQSKSVSRSIVHEEDEKTVIGKNTIVSQGCVIFSNVKIGDDCLLGDHVSIREQNTIGDSTLIGRSVTINYNTKIGSRVKIMDGTHITGNVVIEDNVFISTKVATTNDNSMGKLNYSEEHIVGATFKEGSCVGAGATFLPNVVVGKNAIVGAAALVTKDVPDNAVVMGVPARIVRYIK